MSETIYRKYRPLHFADLVGQRHVRITLEHALERQRVASAYLFSGPRGIGKTTVARILARAVNCTARGKKTEPCDQCPSCLAILGNKSLDVIEIDAASQTGVDNVRENIIQNARAVPSLSAKKVFIIDEVHMLSLPSFNALLKLLEEPPAHAMFILATTEPQKVPDTVISRTQRFDFRLIPFADMVARLKLLAQREKRRLSDDVAERIARLAAGSLRDAESTFGQLLSLGKTDIDAELADLVLPRSDSAVIIAIMTALIQRQAVAAVGAFHTFCGDGGDIGFLANDLVRHARALMLIKVDATQAAQLTNEFDPSTLSELTALAATVELNHLVYMTEELILAQRRLYQAVIQELPLEIAFIKICDRPTIRPITGEKNSPSPAATTIPTAIPPGPSNKRSMGKLTLAVVHEAWGKLHQVISRTQPSLALSIKQAEVVDWADGQLSIRVPFKLHADRMTSGKHKAMLEDQLSELCGAPVRLAVTHDPQATVTLPIKPVVNLAPVSHPQSVTPVTGDLWDQVVASFPKE